MQKFINKGADSINNRINDSINNAKIGGNNTLDRLNNGDSLENTNIFKIKNNADF